MSTCGYTTSTGEPCRNPVDDGERCHLHDAKPARTQDEARRLAEQARAKHEAARRPTRPDPIDEAPLSDQQAEAIAAALNRHDVRYVVMGGLGSQLHGAPLPRSKDADVVVERSPENLRRLCAALRELDARLRVGGGPVDGVDVDLAPDLFKSMVTTTFVTQQGPLDVMFRPDGTDGYDDVATNAGIVRLGDEQLPVADLADIIRSKEAAGRPKDLAALPVLRRFLRRRP